jgi:hypothetical protein
LAIEGAFKLVEVELTEISFVESGSPLTSVTVTEPALEPGETVPCEGVPGVALPLAGAVGKMREIGLVVAGVMI